MRYRKTTPEDIAAVTALWRQVFGDEPVLIGGWLHRFVGENNQYAAFTEDGALAGILSAVPCRTGETQGVYLFALATHPRFRRQGIMAGLMEYAEAAAKREGAAFAVLIPAFDDLFAYYSRLGYTACACMRHVVWEYKGVFGVPASTTGQNADTLWQLRARYLPQPYIKFSLSAEEELWRDIRRSGGQLLRANGGYAVYFTAEQRLLVAELASVNNADAAGVLDAVCEQTGIYTAEITLPESSKLLANQGKSHPFALYRCFTLQNDFEVPYLRFALEEVV